MYANATKRHQICDVEEFYEVGSHATTSKYVGHISLYYETSKSKYFKIHYNNVKPCMPCVTWCHVHNSFKCTTNPLPMYMYQSLHSLVSDTTCYTMTVLHVHVLLMLYLHLLLLFVLENRRLTYYMCPH